jgi:hypothetical protein
MVNTGSYNASTYGSGYGTGAAGAYGGATTAAPGTTAAGGGYGGYSAGGTGYSTEGAYQQSAYNTPQSGYGTTQQACHLCMANLSFERAPRVGKGVQHTAAVGPRHHAAAMRTLHRPTHSLFKYASHLIMSNIKLAAAYNGLLLHVPAGSVQHAPVRLQHHAAGKHVALFRCNEVS